MPAFARTIGIDYSGAETPTASLKGLRVYLAEVMPRRRKFRRPRTEKHRTIHLLLWISVALGTAGAPSKRQMAQTEKSCSISTTFEKRTKFVES